jgi:hypothetical protein
MRTFHPNFQFHYRDERETYLHIIVRGQLYFPCTSTALKCSSGLSPEVTKTVQFFPCVLETELQSSIVFPALGMDLVCTGHHDSLNYRIKSKKNKFVPVYAMKAYRRSKGTAPLILNLNTHRISIGTLSRKEFRFWLPALLKSIGTATLPWCLINKKNFFLKIHNLISFTSFVRYSFR